jgi:uncharacterized damage-inducible protein DinB
LFATLTQNHRGWGYILNGVSAAGVKISLCNRGAYVPEGSAGEKLCLPVFTKEGVKALHRWTHECLDMVCSHAGTLPFALLTREIPGASHGTIRNQLVHVFNTEAAWVGDLRNVSLDEWKAEAFLNLDSLLAAKRKVMADTAAYLDGLSEAALNAEIAARPKAWVGPLRSPAFILHHVVTHAFHHKGQIAMMYRMLGHPIGDTDLQRSEAK